MEKELPKRKESKLVKLLQEANSVYGLPLETIALKAQIESSNIKQQTGPTRASLTGEIETLDQKDYGDILKGFTGNNRTIPSCMTLNYWTMINFWGEMWANKFIIECENSKLKNIIYKLIKHACIFNNVAFQDLETYGLLNVLEVNKWTGEFKKAVLNVLPSNSADVVSYSESGIVYKDKESMPLYDPSKVAVLNWRDTSLCDYVLMIQPLCLEMYKKMVIDVDAANNLAVPTVKVGNAESFITEINWNRNPFNGCKVQVIDSENGGGINKWELDNIHENMSLEKLHNDLRFHQEYYFNLMGFESKTGKGQALTVDVELGEVRTLTIQNERYRRVQLFIEKIEELTGEQINVQLDNAYQREAEENARQGVKKLGEYKTGGEGEGVNYNVNAGGNE